MLKRVGQCIALVFSFAAGPAFTQDITQNVITLLTDDGAKIPVIPMHPADGINTHNPGVVTRLQMPSLIPVTVEGSLDLPNVTMNTGGEGQNDPTTDTMPLVQTSPLQPNPAQLFQGILNELTKPR